MSADDAQTPGFSWASLVAGVLHPVDVQVIEALRWINQPLSAGELARILDGPQSWAQIGHHLRRLAKLDAVEQDETLMTQSVMDITYRLVPRPSISADRNPLAVAFGKNLRACRNRAGLSQDVVGDRTSLHRTEVGLLERGTREPRLGTVIKLASALEVPLEELLVGIDWKSEGPEPGEFEFLDPRDVPDE